MARPFPAFGVFLAVSGAAAALALYYLGDGRNDWWMSGVLTAYTTRWFSLAAEDIKAWRGE